MSALVFAGVSVRRGAAIVLAGIDLRFAAGRVAAVIGPNGAGKSTLLEAAAGLRAPCAGAIALDGVPLATIPRRALAQRRAYLPQRAGVDWPIAVERVVALGLAPALPAFGDPPAAFAPRIDRALAECDLLGLRGRPATQLSGGELARVMLARAIVGDPALLIVDEPTAGLDPRHALDAAARLRARADRGAAVILSVHEIDLALRVADDVIALRGGRVLWSAPAAAVDADALSRLYDVEVRLTRDADGASVRFTGGAAVSAARAP